MTKKHKTDSHRGFQGRIVSRGGDRAGPRVSVLQNYLTHSSPTRNRRHQLHRCRCQYWCPRCRPHLERAGHRTGSRPRAVGEVVPEVWKSPGTPHQHIGLGALHELVRAGWGFGGRRTDFDHALLRRECVGQPDLCSAVHARERRAITEESVGKTTFECCTRYTRNCTLRTT